MADGGYALAGAEMERSRLRAVTSNPWLHFFIRRLLGLFLVLAILVVCVFLMVRLIPGDPIVNSLGTDANLSQIEQIRHENGWDQPEWKQFLQYVNDLAHGDLGRAFLSNEPVSDTIKQRLGTSLQLAGAALFLVLALGIPIGIAAGALTREGRRRRVEVIFTSVTSLLAAVPDYLTATILAFLFAVQFRVFPVAGSGSLNTLILPAIAVCLGPTMSLSRLVRLETLNVLAQDYVRTARSQRLPARTIYAKHVLPNVLTAALTIGGVLFANIIGGAVIVENVFNRPGLGTALVAAVIGKQYVVVQGITLVLGFFVVIVNTFVDISLAFLDPRSLAKKS